MRCSCKQCGIYVYMVQAESDHHGCVCPECGYRCNDCMGTNTHVISKEDLKNLAFDPRFSPEAIAANFEDEAERYDDTEDPFIPPMDLRR